MPSTRASTSRRPSRRLSHHSRDEDEDISASRRHLRSMSNATMTSTKSMMSTSSRRDQERRRRIMRASLMGPQVEELTIERRAEILNDIAGDCIVKIIRAGLNWNRSTWRDCKLSWDLVQSHRRTNLFGEDVPPFVMWEDAQPELPRYSARDLVHLNRTMEMCNLVTLAYVILRPDDAETMLPQPRSSRKGKEKARDSAIAGKVDRRNQVLLDAWEKFWLIIPEDQKDKEMPLRLWLDFVTQIYITHQNPTIDPPSASSVALPEITRDVAHEIFDSEAVIRFGRWSMADSFDTDGSGITGLSQDLVAQRWARAIERRHTELRRTRHETLLKRYPYDAFRRDMLAYLESDIVGSGFHLPASDVETSTGDESAFASESEATDVPDIKPRRSSTRSLTNPIQPHPHGHRRSSHDSRRRSDHIVRPGASVLDDDSESDLDAAEASLGEEEEVDPASATGQLEWDMFAEVAREMELERQRSTAASTNAWQAQISQASSAGYDGRRRRTEETETPSKRKKVIPAEEADEWEVRDGATPRALVPPTQQSLSSFHFATRQSNAVQVEWETQTPSHHIRQDTYQRLPGAFADVSQDRTDATSVQHKRIRPVTPPRVSTGEASLPTPESQATPRAAAARQPLASGTVLPDRTGLRLGRSVSRVQRSETPSRLRYGNVPDTLRGVSVPLVMDTPSSRSVQNEKARAPLNHASDIDDLLPDASQLRGDSPTDTSLSEEDRPDALRLSGLRNSLKENQEFNSLLPGPSQLLGDREELFDAQSIESLLPDENELKGDRSETVYSAVAGDVLPDGNDMLGDRRSIELSNPAEDLLPDDQQLLGDLGPSSGGPQIPDALADHDLPFEHHLDSQVEPSEADETRVPLDNGVAHGHHGGDVNRTDEPGYAGPSASGPPPQRLLASARGRYDQDATDFAVPDADEDAADRQFLQARQFAQMTRDAPRERVKMSPGTPPLQPVMAIDPYLVDKDGLPLVPNEEYRIPRNFVFERSTIHGQIDGQSTVYSRIAGKRKWTQEEALLLYRTLQQVPMDQQYPVRVVWYLHGEHGVLSHDLQYFNPQHMKDKLRTTTIARSNNLKPVEGRARAFLPPTYPQRREYDEWVLAEQRRQDAEREAERVRQREEQERERERLAAEREARRAARREAGAEREDEDTEAEDENEDQTTQSEEYTPRSKKKKGAKRSAKETKKRTTRKRTKKSEGQPRKETRRSRKAKESSAEEFESEEEARPARNKADAVDVRNGGESAAVEPSDAAIPSETGNEANEEAGDSDLEGLTSDHEATPTPRSVAKRARGRPKKGASVPSARPDKSSSVASSRRNRLVPEVEIISRPSRSAQASPAAKRPSKKQTAVKSKPKSKQVDLLQGGGVADETDQAELEEVESTALDYRSAEEESAASAQDHESEKDDEEEIEDAGEGEQQLDPGKSSVPPISEEDDEAAEAKRDESLRHQFLRQKVLRGGGL